MSYQCEQCKEASTINDAIDVMIKLATLAAVVYFGVKFRGQIEDSVKLAMGKVQKHLGQSPKRRKRGK